MIMTPKNRRLRRKEIILKSNGNSSDQNISWSSSSSESENDFFPVSKKIKTEIELNKRLCGKIKEKYNKTCLEQSSSVVDELRKSPVISTLKLEELSPVLTKRIQDSNDLSPVIGKKQTYRKIIQTPPSPKSELNKFVNNVDLFIENSPELLTGNSQPVIHDSLSPDNQIQISQMSYTQSSSPINSIQSVSSFDESPAVVTNFDSTLYYELPPKRKKRYKKGSLVHQLKKVLSQQETSIAIWKHEQYLNKTKGCDGSNNTFEMFKIINKLIEYGCEIFQCKTMKVDRLDKTDLINLTNDNKNYLIINNVRNICDTNLENGNIIKLYPPFIKKIISYNSDCVNCYFNVTKIELCM